MKVEIATNQKGDVLWIEPYPFNRIFAPGDSFVKDSVEYVVIRSAITFGKCGGVLVEHVIKEVSHE